MNNALVRNTNIWKKVVLEVRLSVYLLAYYDDLKQYQKGTRSCNQVGLDEGLINQSIHQFYGIQANQEIQYLFNTFEQHYLRFYQNQKKTLIFSNSLNFSQHKHRYKTVVTKNYDDSNPY